MSFPVTYSDARTRFVDTAARLGWPMRACAVDGEGPAGEPLAIDVAESPEPAGAGTLVLSSGLHGVEAPLGSAMQVEVMERWAGSAGEGRVRCVLVHALNPFGFAWSRRVDAENVDLNRNFVDRSPPFTGCPPEYRMLDPLLNPPRLPARWDFFALRAVAAAARFGRAALRAAVAAGQHEYPKGLFYGGAAPAATRRILEGELPRRLSGAEHVVHLDVHTGLGARGTHKLLVDYPTAPARADRLLRWFGRNAFPGGSPERLAYRARGSFGPWLVARGLAPDYTFAFVEFGTYGELAVLAGLRAENQAYHAGGPRHPARVAAAGRLRELFCPADAAWRGRALIDGLAIVDRAVHGLLSAADGAAPG